MNPPLTSSASRPCTLPSHTKLHIQHRHRPFPFHPPPLRLFQMRSSRPHNSTSRLGRSDLRRPQTSARPLDVRPDACTDEENVVRPLEVFPWPGLCWCWTQLVVGLAGVASQLGEKPKGLRLKRSHTLFSFGAGQILSHRVGARMKPAGAVERAGGHRTWLPFISLLLFKVCLVLSGDKVPVLV